MIKKFKDLTGQYHFVFKSDIDEALANTRTEPITLYQPRGNGTAVYYVNGGSAEKTNIANVPMIKKTNPEAKIVMCSGSISLNQDGVGAGADMAISKAELGRNNSINKQEGFAKELKDLLN